MLHVPSVRTARSVKMKRSAATGSDQSACHRTVAGLTWAAALVLEQPRVSRQRAKQIAQRPVEAGRRIDQLRQGRVVSARAFQRRATDVARLLAVGRPQARMAHERVHVDRPARREPPTSRIARCTHSSTFLPASVTVNRTTGGGSAHELSARSLSRTGLTHRPPVLLPEAGHSARRVSTSASPDGLSAPGPRRLLRHGKAEPIPS